jgi:hypothetical protein
MEILASGIRGLAMCLTLLIAFPLFLVFVEVYSARVFINQPPSLQVADLHAVVAFELWLNSFHLRRLAHG